MLKLFSIFLILNATNCNVRRNLKKPVHTPFSENLCALPHAPEHAFWKFVTLPSQARKDVNGINFFSDGSILEALCKESYKIKGEYPKRECKDGKWQDLSSHANGTCEKVVDSQEFPHIKNAKFTHFLDNKSGKKELLYPKLKVAIENSILATCNEGFIAYPSEIRFKLNKNGAWIEENKGAECLSFAQIKTKYSDKNFAIVFSKKFPEIFDFSETACKANPNDLVWQDGKCHISEELKCQENGKDLLLFKENRYSCICDAAKDHYLFVEASSSSCKLEKDIHCQNHEDIIFNEDGSLQCKDSSESKNSCQLSQLTDIANAVYKVQDKILFSKKPKHEMSFKDGLQIDIECNDKTIPFPESYKKIDVTCSQGKWSVHANFECRTLNEIKLSLHSQSANQKKPLRDLILSLKEFTDAAECSHKGLEWHEPATDSAYCAVTEEEQCGQGQSLIFDSQKSQWICACSVNTELFRNDPSEIASCRDLSKISCDDGLTPKYEDANSKIKTCKPKSCDKLPNKELFTNAHLKIPTVNEESHGTKIPLTCEDPSYISKSALFMTCDLGTWTLGPDAKCTDKKGVYESLATDTSVDIQTKEYTSTLTKDDCIGPHLHWGKIGNESDHCELKDNFECREKDGVLFADGSGKSVCKCPIGKHFFRNGEGIVQCRELQKPLCTSHEKPEISKDTYDGESIYECKLQGCTQPPSKTIGFVANLSTYYPINSLFTEKCGTDTFQQGNPIQYKCTGNNSWEKTQGSGNCVLFAEVIKTKILDSSLDDLRTQIALFDKDACSKNNLEWDAKIDTCFIKEDKDCEAKNQGRARYENGKYICSCEDLPSPHIMFKGKNQNTSCQPKPIKCLDTEALFFANGYAYCGEIGTSTNNCSFHKLKNIPHAFYYQNGSRIDLTQDMISNKSVQIHCSLSTIPFPFPQAALSIGCVNGKWEDTPKDFSCKTVKEIVSELHKEPNNHNKPLRGLIPSLANISADGCLSSRSLIWHNGQCTFEYEYYHCSKSRENSILYLDKIGDSRFKETDYKYSKCACPPDFTYLSNPNEIPKCVLETALQCPQGYEPIKHANNYACEEARCSTEDRAFQKFTTIDVIIPTDLEKTKTKIPLDFSCKNQLFPNIETKLTCSLGEWKLDENFKCVNLTDFLSSEKDLETTKPISEHLPQIGKIDEHHCIGSDLSWDKTNSICILSKENECKKSNAKLFYTKTGETECLCDNRNRTEGEKLYKYILGENSFICETEADASKRCKVGEGIYRGPNSETIECLSPASICGRPEYASTHIWDGNNCIDKQVFINNCTGTKNILTPPGISTCITQCDKKPYDGPRASFSQLSLPYSIGGQLTASCKPGYIQYRPLTFTCTNDGSWSSENVDSACLSFDELKKQLAKDNHPSILSKEYIDIANIPQNLCKSGLFFQDGKCHIKEDIDCKNKKMGLAQFIGKTKFTFSCTCEGLGKSHVLFKDHKGEVSCTQHVKCDSRELSVLADGVVTCQSNEYLEGSCDQGDLPEIPNTLTQRSPGIFTKDKDSLTIQCDEFTIPFGIDTHMKLQCKNKHWIYRDTTFKCLSLDAIKKKAPKDNKHDLESQIPLLSSLNSSECTDKRGLKYDGKCHIKEHAACEAKNMKLVYAEGSFTCGCLENEKYFYFKDNSQSTSPQCTSTHSCPSGYKEAKATLQNFGEYDTCIPKNCTTESLIYYLKGTNLLPSYPRTIHDEETYVHCKNGFVLKAGSSSKVKCEYGQWTGKENSTCNPIDLEILKRETDIKDTIPHHKEVCKKPLVWNEYLKKCYEPISSQQIPELNSVHDSKTCKIIKNTQWKNGKCVLAKEASCKDGEILLMDKDGHQVCGCEFGKDFFEAKDSTHPMCVTQSEMKCEGLDKVEFTHHTRDGFKVYACLLQGCRIPPHLKNASFPEGTSGPFAFEQTLQARCNPGLIKYNGDIEYTCTKEKNGWVKNNPSAECLSFKELKSKHVQSKNSAILSETYKDIQTIPENLCKGGLLYKEEKCRIEEDYKCEQKYHGTANFVWNANGFECTCAKDSVMFKADNGKQECKSEIECGLRQHPVMKNGIVVCEDASHLKGLCSLKDLPTIKNAVFKLNETRVGNYRDILVFDPSRIILSCSDSTLPFPSGNSHIEIKCESAHWSSIPENFQCLTLEQIKKQSFTEEDEQKPLSELIPSLKHFKDTKCNDKRSLLWDTETCHIKEEYDNCKDINKKLIYKHEGNENKFECGCEKDQSYFRAINEAPKCVANANSTCDSLTHTREERSEEKYGKYLTCIPRGCQLYTDIKKVLEERNFDIPQFTGVMEHESSISLTCKNGFSLGNETEFLKCKFGKWELTTASCIETSQLLKDSISEVANTVENITEEKNCIDPHRWHNGKCYTHLSKLQKIIRFDDCPPPAIWKDNACHLQEEIQCTDKNQILWIDKDKKTRCGCPIGQDLFTDSHGVTSCKPKQNIQSNLCPEHHTAVQYPDQTEFPVYKCKIQGCIGNPTKDISGVNLTENTYTPKGSSITAECKEGFLQYEDKPTYKCTEESEGADPSWQKAGTGECLRFRDYLNKIRGENDTIELTEHFVKDLESKIHSFYKVTCEENSDLEFENKLFFEKFGQCKIKAVKNCSEQGASAEFMKDRFRCKCPKNQVLFAQEKTLKCLPVKDVKNICSGYRKLGNPDNNNIQKCEDNEEVANHCSRRNLPHVENGIVENKDYDELEAPNTLVSIKCSDKFLSYENGSVSIDTTCISEKKWSEIPSNFRCENLNTALSHIDSQRNGDTVAQIFPYLAKLPEQDCSEKRGLKYESNRCYVAAEDTCKKDYFNTMLLFDSTSKDKTRCGCPKGQKLYKRSDNSYECTTPISLTDKQEEITHTDSGIKEIINKRCTNSDLRKFDVASKGLLLDASESVKDHFDHNSLFPLICNENLIPNSYPLNLRCDFGAWVLEGHPHCSHLETLVGDISHQNTPINLQNIHQTLSKLTTEELCKKNTAFIWDELKRKQGCHLKQEYDCYKNQKGILISNGSKVVCGCEKGKSLFKSEPNKAPVCTKDSDISCSDMQKKVVSSTLPSISSCEDIQCTHEFPDLDVLSFSKKVINQNDHSSIEDITTESKFIKNTKIIGNCITSLIPYPSKDITYTCTADGWSKDNQNYACLSFNQLLDKLQETKTDSILSKNYPEITSTDYTAILKECKNKNSEVIYRSSKKRMECACTEEGQVLSENGCVLKSALREKCKSIEKLATDANGVTSCIPDKELENYCLLEKKIPNTIYTLDAHLVEVDDFFKNGTKIKISCDEKTIPYSGSANLPTRDTLTCNSGPKWSNVQFSCKKLEDIKNAIKSDTNQYNKNIRNFIPILSQIDQVDCTEERGLSWDSTYKCHIIGERDCLASGRKYMFDGSSWTCKCENGESYFKKENKNPACISTQNATCSDYSKYEISDKDGYKYCKPRDCMVEGIVKVLNNKNYKTPTTTIDHEKTIPLTCADNHIPKEAGDAKLSCSFGTPTLSENSGCIKLTDLLNQVDGNKKISDLPSFKVIEQLPKEACEAAGLSFINDQCHLYKCALSDLKIELDSRNFTSSQLPQSNQFYNEGQNLNVSCTEPKIPYPSAKLTSSMTCKEGKWELEDKDFICSDLETVIASLSKQHVGQFVKDHIPYLKTTDTSHPECSKWPGTSATFDGSAAKCGCGPGKKYFEKEGGGTCVADVNCEKGFKETKLNNTELYNVFKCTEESCTKPNLTSLELQHFEFVEQLQADVNDYEINTELHLYCKNTIPNKSKITLSCHKGGWLLTNDAACKELKDLIFNSGKTYKIPFLNDYIKIKDNENLKYISSIDKSTCEKTSTLDWKEVTNKIKGNKKHICLIKHECKKGTTLALARSNDNPICMCDNFQPKFVDNEENSQTDLGSVLYFDNDGNCKMENTLIDECKNSGGILNKDDKIHAKCLHGFEACSYLDSKAKSKDEKRVWYDDGSQKRCEFRSRFNEFCSNEQTTLDASTPPKCTVKSGKSSEWDKICKSDYWLDGKNDDLCKTPDDKCPQGSIWNEEKKRCKYNDKVKMIILSGFDYFGNTESEVIARKVIKDSHSKYIENQKDKDSYKKISFSKYKDKCNNEISFNGKNSSEKLDQKQHRNVVSDTLEPNCLGYWGKIYYLKQILNDDIYLDGKTWMLWLDDDMVLRKDHSYSLLQLSANIPDTIHIVMAHDKDLLKIKENENKKIEFKDGHISTNSNLFEVNTGFIMVRLSEKSKEIINKWYELRNQVVMKGNLPMTLGLCRNQICFHEQEAYNDYLRKDFPESFKIFHPDEGLNNLTGINRFVRVSHYDPSKELDQRILAYESNEKGTGDPDFIKCDVKKDIMCQCTGLARKGFKLSTQSYRALVISRWYSIENAQLPSDITKFSEDEKFHFFKNVEINDDYSYSSYNFRKFCIEKLLEGKNMKDDLGNMPRTLAPSPTPKTPQ